MTFQGVHNNAIDAKGRASIPAKFREVLGDEQLMVTQHKGGLVAYPLSEWQKIVENVNNMPAGPKREAINLSLLTPAIPCPFDKQGRIQLSKPLREYAGLEEVREVVLVGSFNKIQLWNRSTHEEMMRAAEALVNEDPQTLYDLGF
jgi:MraZ protein